MSLGEGLLHECLDRAVFWAELGLVSSPAVLARLGRVLHECASEDHEIREAIELAAAHVQQECLLVSRFASHRKAAGGGQGAAHVTVISTSASSTSYIQSMLQMSNKSAGGSEFVNDSLSSSDTSASSDQDEDDATATVQSVWVEVLPLLATRLPRFVLLTCKTLGLVIVVLGGCLQLLVACIDKADIPESYGDRGFSSLVFRIDYLSAAFHVFACIPMSVGMFRLAQSDAMRKLRRRRDVNTDIHRLSCFIRSALVFAALLTLGGISSSACWSLALSKYPGVLLGGYQRGVNLVTWSLYYLHTGAVTMTFSLLWKLSSEALETMRMQVGEREERPDWLAMARTYNITSRQLYELWRSGSFGLAVLTVIIMKLCGVVWSMLLGMRERDFAWWLYHLVSASLDASYIMAMLYMMANIESKCRGTRASQNSVLNSAAKHYGWTLPKDSAKHCHFVHSVLHLPCGVELWPLGTVTMGRAMHSIRFFVAVIPSCFAWGLRAMQDES